jgi:serine/threonine protein kinase
MCMYDCGLTDTYQCIVLEYCGGGSLQAAIRKHASEDTLDEPRVLSWALQLAKALSYLHNKCHLVHRDVKSDNVLLTSDGRLKLADLGLAALLEDGASARSAAGCLVYLPPEAFKERKMSFPADMWALGCVLAEACMGKFLFECQRREGAFVGAYRVCA